jgi:hypothetical protein
MKIASLSCATVAAENWAFAASMALRIPPA